MSGEAATRQDDGGDVRRQRRALLGCGAALLVVPLAGVVLFGLVFWGGPQPQVDTTTGHGRSRALGRHLRAYNLRVPDATRGLAWAEVVTWDTTELYLRLTTSRSGLRTMLRENQLGARLRPVGRQGSDALPRDHWTRGYVGREPLAWAPSGWGGARQLTSRGVAPNRSPRYVEVLVVPLGSQKEVFVRVSQ